MEEALLLVPTNKSKAFPIISDNNNKKKNNKKKKTKKKNSKQAQKLRLYWNYLKVILIKP